MVTEVKILGETIASGQFSRDDVIKILGYWTAAKIVVRKVLGKKNTNKITKKAKKWRDENINNLTK